MLPRRVHREGVAGRVDPGLVQDDQLLGDLLDGGPNPGLGPLPVRAVEPAQGGRLSPGVGAQQVDLIGGHVQLVAALVFEQQVIALHPADGAAHHAPEATDAVLVVDHEATDGQVIEEGLGVAGPGSGPAVGPPTTGEVALRQHRQLERGIQEAAFERLEHDPDTGIGQGGRGGGVVEGGGQTVIAQQGGQPGAAASTLGAHHDPIPVGPEAAQLAHQPFAVADDRVPSGRGDHLGARALRGGRHGQDGGVGVGEQPIERQVQARKLLASGPPGLGQGAGQGRLLLEQLGGPVAHAARLDQQHQGVGGQEVDEQVLLDW